MFGTRLANVIHNRQTHKQQGLRLPYQSKPSKSYRYTSSSSFSAEDEDYDSESPMPIFGASRSESQEPGLSYDDFLDLGGSRNVGDLHDKRISKHINPRIKFHPNRLHYDTVTQVHEPVYKWAMDCKMEEIKKIVEYDCIKELGRTIKNTAQNVVKTGDEKVAELKYWLDHMGLKRHIHQVRFHENMIKGCLTKIYEAEWETQYESIMRKFDVVKMKRELLFACPRRFGKTVSVAMYVAAYMLTIPNCRVAVFSTGKRMAKKLMMLIINFLRRCPIFEKVLETKNQEDLILRFCTDDTREASCYPASVQVGFF
jgi:hypothetical protein